MTKHRLCLGPSQIPIQEREESAKCKRECKRKGRQGRWKVGCESRTGRKVRTASMPGRSDRGLRHEHSTLVPRGRHREAVALIAPGGLLLAPGISGLSEGGKELGPALKSLGRVLALVRLQTKCRSVQGKKRRAAKPRASAGVGQGEQSGDERRAADTRGQPSGRWIKDGEAQIKQGVFAAFWSCRRTGSGSGSGSGSGNRRRGSGGGNKWRRIWVGR